MESVRKKGGNEISISVTVELGEIGVLQGRVEIMRGEE
jgi:hypothetical protein